MMTYEEALVFLENAKSAGIRPGLSRIEELLHLVGDPQRQLRVIHVAGTNGKGSTARMIQCLLTAAGHMTGLYSSPAVTGLRDTITIDGAAISKEAFAEGMTVLRRAAERMTDMPSEFELTTALCFWQFARERVDIAVLECGLGGLEDATNICPPPLAAVLTPVALDHTALLGNTIEAITRQKCGILKPPCAVIASPGQPVEALGEILACAAEKGLTVRQPNRMAADVLEEGWGRLAFKNGGVRYTLPLSGAFQLDNALTALETADALAERGVLVPPEVRPAGLAAAAMPCREEVAGWSPLVLLDGAHNPHAAAQLAETVRRYGVGGPLTLLTGMLRDKDTAACAALLAPLCAHVVCCTPPSPRALPAAQLAAQYRAICPDVETVPEPAEALAKAREKAGENALLVAGSFYLAAAVRPLLLR